MHLRLSVVVGRDAAATGIPLGGLPAAELGQATFSVVKDLPPGVTPYNRTPEFTQLSTPKALLKSHSTKPGTWGRIVVLEGSLTYRILEPQINEFRLDPEHPGTIEPTVSHEVYIDAEVRFFVQFYRDSVA